MVFEQVMADAAAEGRAAAKAKTPRRDNPYQSDSADPRERVKALMWRRGWSEGNPVVVDATT